MNKRHPIYSRLSSGALLFDGATGTYARHLPGFPAGAVELACIHAPQKVHALHQEYLMAGCNLIKTNTFAAHPGLAAKDEAQQEQIISAAFGIASRAAKQFDAFVFADIGPAPSTEEPLPHYIRAAECFLRAGADCFLFETMPCANGLKEAAEYIRERRPEAFIAVSFAAQPDGFTRTGELAAELIASLEESDAIDALGLNCVCGAYHMRLLIEQLIPCKKPLIAMPNAGYPHLIDGRMYYDSDPSYFSEQVASCAMAGAAFVGGCCGTTPAHIAQLSKLIGNQIANSLPAKKEQNSGEQICRSEILQKLQAGKRPVLVELDPPKSAQIEGFISGARRLHDIGADAITIADCPIGRARMDSSILACKLKREYGIETIPHMTCRDRNVNATKALLLGLSMEGVRNVLAVTGDPVPAGERESVKGVFQFHSRILSRFITSLCRSGEASPFFLCGALNVNAANFDAELEKARQKEECGVEAFLTQPILSERAAENLHRARETLRAYLFGGLFPIVSERNAQFMASEVSGVALDDRVISAYSGLDRKQGEELAVRLCLDAAERIKADVDGYYIMTPFQRTKLVEDIIRGIKE